MSYVVDFTKGVDSPEVRSASLLERFKGAWWPQFRRWIQPIIFRQWNQEVFPVSDVDALSARIEKIKNVQNICDLQSKIENIPSLRQLKESVERIMKGKLSEAGSVAAAAAAAAAAVSGPSKQSRRDVTAQTGAAPAAPASSVEGSAVASGTSKQSRRDASSASSVSSASERIDPHPAPTQAISFLACPGIQNAGNRCFGISVIKALWSSPKLRALIEQEPDSNEFAVITKRIFQKLDQGETEKSLKKDDEDVMLLLSIVVAELRSDLGTQQDATEFLEKFFDILYRGQEKYLCQYVEKSTVQESPPDCLVPGVNTSEDVALNVYRIPFAHGDKRIFLQDEIREFGMDVIANKQEILQKGLNPKGEELEEKATSIDGKVFFVTKQRRFKTTSSPLFLPIQLARFNSVDFEESKKDFLEQNPGTRVEEGASGKVRVIFCGELKPTERSKDDFIEMVYPGKIKKRQDPVDIPRELSIFCEEEKTQKYQLRSVVIHNGKIATVGHYYSYVFPQGESPQDVVYRHDDDKVDPVSLQNAMQDIQKNGYMCFYDQMS